MITGNPVYRPIQTTDKRYVLITGGRGSAKSFHVNTLLGLLTYNPGHKLLNCRYTLTSAQDSIIPEFQSKIESMGVQHHFNFVKNNATNLTTGVEVLFRGIKTSSGKQTAKLKSIPGITTVFIDEMEEFDDEEAFDTIDYSVRQKGIKNTIIMVMNPPTDDHFIFQRYIKDTHKIIMVDGYPIMISTHPKVLHIHTTYLDNIQHLDQSFLDNVEVLRNGNKAQRKKYAHIILGQFSDQKEGVVFENWSYGPFNTQLPYCYGLDLGYFPNPAALVKVAVDHRRKKIWVKEEFYGTKKATPVLIEIIKNRIHRQNDLIVCDTNESRTLRSMRDAGLNVKRAFKGGVSGELGEMLGYELIVDPSSNKFAFELKNYVWNDKKASIPVKEHDHGIDAARYAANRLTNKWKL